MSTNVFEMEASEATGDYESPPAGTHIAVCVALIDLGTHESDYQGAHREDRKVLVVWELVNELRTDGDHHVVWAEFNAMPKISAKANLRKMLEGWRGSPYNARDKIKMTEVLGHSCLLNLIEKTSTGGKTYVKVKEVVPVPRGTPRPRPSYDPFLWTDLANPFDGPDWLPYIYGKSIADYIAESMEAQGIPVTDRATTNGRPAGQLAGDQEDANDIPF